MEHYPTIIVKWRGGSYCRESAIWTFIRSR